MQTYILFLAILVYIVYTYIYVCFSLFYLFKLLRSFYRARPASFFASAFKNRTISAKLHKKSPQSKLRAPMCCGKYTDEKPRLRIKRGVGEHIYYSKKSFN